MDEQLKYLLQHPEAEIDTAWALDILDRQPCFSFLAALTLKRNAATLTPEQRHELMRRAALYAPDKEALLAMCDPDEAERQGFYPPDPALATPTTDDAIATFLENYGHTSPEEESLLERMIFNPVPDYAGVLEADDTSTPAADAAAAPADSQDALINKFIAEQGRPVAAATPAEAAAAEEPAPAPAPEPQPIKSVAAHSELADSLLGESLAKIYIRKRRYAKAYEIISQLNLNFPEKSVYFADQLRFLRKMMLVEQYIIKNS